MWVMILFTVSTQGLYEPPSPAPVITQVFISSGIESSSTWVRDTVIVDRAVYLDEPRLFANHTEVSKFVSANYLEWRGVYDSMPKGICVDYATAYQRFALSKGYLVSTQLDIKGDEGHAHLSAWTQDGKCIYFDVDSIVTRVGAVKGGL